MKACTTVSILAHTNTLTLRPNTRRLPAPSANAEEELRGAQAEAAAAQTAAEEALQRVRAAAAEGNDDLRRTLEVSLRVNRRRGEGG